MWPLILDIVTTILVDGAGHCDWRYAPNSVNLASMEALIIKLPIDNSFCDCALTVDGGYHGV